MSVIVVKCTDQVLTFENTPIITSGGRGEDFVKFSFCTQWDGFVKTAVFWRTEHEPYHVLLDKDNTCTIPYEVLTKDGRFYFGVFGVNSGYERRTSEVLAYMVAKGAITEGTQPSDPTPEIYDRLLAEYAATQAKYEESIKTGKEITKAVEECIKTVQEKLVHLLPEIREDQIGYYVRAAAGGVYELAPPPLSAYESAQKGGYTGTEAEFYAALAALGGGTPGGDDTGGDNTGGDDSGGDSGDTKLITWYLEDETDGTRTGSYNAVSGMTWEEFIESEYNTIGLGMSSDGYVGGSDTRLSWNSTEQHIDDVIQADETYILAY